MKVFNVDKYWDDIKKYINDPIVQLALDLGMEVYTETMPALPGPWHAVKAPWMYSEDDAWDYVAFQKFEASGIYKEWSEWSNKQAPKNLTEEELEVWYNSDAALAICDQYKELMAAFYPQPDTPDWYRCIGASDFLGAFNCALGMRVAPHLKWKVVSGQKHTTAIGYEDKHSILCFDILWCRKTAGEILKGIKPILWRVTLGEELTTMKHVLGKGAI